MVAGAAWLSAGPATADVKAGVDAWSKGDYKAAISEWMGPASRGDPDAQFNLAQAYKLGRGVDQDLAKAESLYQQAAAKGHLRAADNYGLLLFQRGERAKAMPYIQAAAGRGDPRAQYVLGVAHFNGDNVPKDWVRAYALVSLAQRAGLPQATPALGQMDKHIPLEQRQESVLLASELAEQAAANRASQVAASDLETPPPTRGRTGPAAERPPASSEGAARGGPGSAGADYARPQAPAAGAPAPKGWIEVPPGSASQATPKAAPAAKPAGARAATDPPAKPAQAAKPSPAAAVQGAWRVQLGAFGVAANADKLWTKVGGRPELSGRRKVLVPAGRLTKLQAGGFASRAEAEAACSRLKSAGYDCLAVEE